MHGNGLFKNSEESCVFICFDESSKSVSNVSQFLPYYLVSPPDDFSRHMHGSSGPTMQFLTAVTFKSHNLSYFQTFSNRHRSYFWWVPNMLSRFGNLPHATNLLQGRFL